MTSFSKNHQELGGVCPFIRQYMDQTADNTLVLKAKQGNQTAFHALMQKYQAGIYSLACRFNSKEDAADITQQVFILAFKRLETLREGAQFESWLKRIAINLSLNLKRYKGSRPVCSLEEMRGAGEAMISSEADPSAKLDTKERERHVLEAIRTLSPYHRAVVILCDLEGHSYKEAGDILDCSVGTVMSRLYYARKILRAKLIHLWEDVK